MKKSISVVIPNYNGEQLLRNNLPLLYSALAAVGVDYEIIIPDDASTDQSLAFLQTHYPRIITIVHTQNQGFATNINAGIRKASKDLVFLLNSDIELSRDYFVPLLAYFEDPSVFGVTGRILGNDSDQIQDGAKYPDYHFGHIGATLNFTLQNDTPPGHQVPTFFMSGANILADRQKLFLLDGFDELFSPFYSEDAELGLRAWRLGYRCLYEHQAVCRHPNSVTIKKYNPRRKIRIVAKRNKYYLHYLHLNGMELACWFFILLVKTLFRALIWDSKHLESVRQFVAGLPAAARSKQKFQDLQQQQHTRLSVRQVRNLIVKQIGQLPIQRF